MLRKCLTRLARRKHGQRGWSPNASSSGAAPATGLTMQEALQVAYRPMPPSQTVEYEEDFGHNMLIHREFVSKKHRQQMTFDMSTLAYSDVELCKGRQRLADAMNRERRGTLVGAGGMENDRVVFSADLGGDEQAGNVESARYLFNERRLQYCDNFQECLRKLAKGPEEDSEDTQVLFSVMEACAILYGCDTTAAQEAYYRAFCRLDLASLEDDALLLAELQEDAEVVRTRLNSGQHRTPSQVQQVIDAMPTLFDSLDSSGEEDSHQRQLASSSFTSASEPVKGAEVKVQKEAEAQLSSSIDVPDAFAPLYRSYLAHTEGQTPTPSHDVSSLVAAGDLAERRRWREVMEKLVREDYGNVTRGDLKAAAKLNEQLHTVKFMDLKVGDTVKDIMALLQRETGDGSSVDRSVPLEVSPTHPERRV